MNRKLVIIISSLYVVFMATISIFYHINGDSYRSLVAIGGVICGALSLLFSFILKQPFNFPLIISYFIFLFGSQYLGSILNWYGLGWWDTFIHFFSGAILAFTGTLLYKRIIQTKINDETSPWFIFLFSLSFAALGGVLWEIYEFSFDQFFNMTLQGGGISDTMIDLIADTLGGLIMAIWAGFKKKKE